MKKDWLTVANKHQHTNVIYLSTLAKHNLILIISIVCANLYLSLLSYMQDSDYISIKDPTMDTKPTKNIKDKKQEKEIADDNKKESSLVEVQDSNECESYSITNGYKCKQCGKFVLEEQKPLHPVEHELEPTKLGVRYKCTKCSTLFIGKLLPLSNCPKCKSKLSSSIIEVIEISNDNEKYYINKKNDRKICNTDEKHEKINKEEK